MKKLYKSSYQYIMVVSLQDDKFTCMNNCVQKVKYVNYKRLFNKTKNKKYHTVETIPKSNCKIFKNM